MMKLWLLGSDSNERCSRMFSDHAVHAQVRGCSGSRLVTRLCLRSHEIKWSSQLTQNESDASLGEHVVFTLSQYP